MYYNNPRNTKHSGGMKRGTGYDFFKSDCNNGYFDGRRNPMF